MNSVTAREMKEIDRKAIEEYGIPSIVLMENAGRGVSEVVLAMLKNMGAGKVAVFCGKGNNGGDGFTAARHLINKRMEAAVFLVGRKEELSNEARTNFDVLIKMGIKIDQIQEESDWERVKPEIVDTDLIVDALLGIGLSGEVRGLYQSAIEFLNQAPQPVLSVDIPSGLDADTGRPRGTAIKAQKTATLGLLKSGLITELGMSYAGEVVVVDIGIPHCLNINNHKNM